MIIHIKPESATPIYVQLVYQIKIGILKKELIPGEMLPSIRSLASDIGIHMHTVNKAYLQLVKEKILTSHKNGFQVREREQMYMSDTYQEEFKLKLTELMIDAAIYQLSEKEVNDIRESINTEIQRREGK